MSTTNGSFLQIRGDKDFQQRSESIFASVDRLELSKEEKKESKKSRRPQTVPDHVLHPEKWTEYSLEEDGSEGFGRMDPNEINKYAAFSFLNDVKKRRKCKEEDIESLKKSVNCSVSDDSKCDESSPTSEMKFSFSKPIKDKSEIKNVIKQNDGVHTMPEYIVGKTKLTGNTKKLKVEASTTQDDEKKRSIKIDHLLLKQDELADLDAKDSGIFGISAPKEEWKENREKEEVKFAKRKRKHDKNIRKHMKTCDDEKNE